MKCDKLEKFDATSNAERSAGIESRYAYDADEVDAAIAELKAKLESVQATAYAESVDAGMRDRRLKRALYKACAMWAKCEDRINNINAYDASEYLSSAEDEFRKKAERWNEMERKCRAKAEEYK